MRTNLRGSFILLLLAFSCQVKAQRISVNFINNEKEPQEHITAELLQGSDSSLVKTAISEKSGTAEFENIRNGSYLVRTSSIHFTPAFTQVFKWEGDKDLRLPDVILTRKAVSELKGVTVEAKKPFIQRLNDRLVLNVENSIVNAGSTVLEILERAPGVTINSSDILSLKGKTGVIIMIDGKPSPMSGSELVTYLRGLPSSLVQQIDIITNPSAKYDAAGNAGIIDIKLKKNQRLGTNGTVSVGYGQGIYPRSNNSASFNYRGLKTNLYGNAGFSYINWMNNLVLRRDFYSNNQYDGSYVQDNFIKRIYRLPSARVGFDYYINNKSVVGIVASTNMNFTKRDSENVSEVLDPQQDHQSSFLTDAKGNENSRNYLVNLNFKHSFDSTGREISFDADYSKFIQDWNSNYNAHYFDKNALPSQPPYLLNLDQEGNLQIKSAKLDYKQAAGKTVSLETGIKTSFVNADNMVLFFDRSAGTPVIDSANSNHFKYNENINAAYLSVKKQFKKSELQVGLRAEETRVSTNELFYNNRRDTNYLHLFPSVFWTYKLNDSKTVGISVSRRIDRPTYGQLNPFRIFVDPSFYASGNPNLRPQITWAYELNYTAGQLNLELSYSKTKDLITYVLMPTANRITLQTALNFESEEYIGLTVSRPAKITSWWNAVNNLNLFYSMVKGYVAETNVDASYLNCIFSTNHSFVLSSQKGWNGEINFYLNTGNRNGVMKDKTAYGLSAGVQKTILNKKGTFRFNVSDILWKTYPRFSSSYTTYREQLKAIRDTRVATLTFSYRFGNSKVQAARRRTTASEEERRRAGGN